MGKRLLRGLLRGMQDFLFPEGEGCCFCGKSMYREGFCLNCWEELSIAKKQEFCRICGRILTNPSLQGCPECQDAGYEFSFARGVGEYRGIYRNLLHQYKYVGKQSLARPMGKLMLDVVLTDRRYEGTEVLVPVPLAPVKLLQRKFNQSQLLAQELGQALDLPVLAEALQRGRDTLTQAKLSREERRANLEGAFMVQRGMGHFLQGRKLLLVDDVFTTGSTAAEAAKVLLSAGAGEVAVLTWATGLVGGSGREGRDSRELEELS